MNQTCIDFIIKYYHKRDVHQFFRNNPQFYPVEWKLSSFRRFQGISLLMEYESYGPYDLNQSNGHKVLAQMIH